MKKVSLMLAVVLTAAGCLKDDKITPQSDLFINPLETQMDQDIHRAFLDYRGKINTVGLTIGVLKDDQVFFYGYGETQKGNKQVPDSTTFFEIGSITKVFTSIAALDFLRERNLGIETPIKAFLPNDLPTLKKGDVEVNFKHLMTHTSGLPYMPDNMGFDLYLNIDEAWRAYSPSKLYQCLKSVKLESVPGARWSYSNLALGTLGHILERNTGKPYEQIIRERISLPLGLLDTKMTLNATEMSRMAKGYKGGKVINYWEDLNALNGAGVLRSTTADLLKFAKINLNLPDTPLGETMRSCQQKYFEGKDKDGNDHISYLGWQDLSIGNDLQPTWFHNGGTGGFSTNLILFQDSRTALVVLFNSIETKESESIARGELLVRLTNIINQ